jgi:hypothetical protein
MSLGKSNPGNLLSANRLLLNAQRIKFRSQFRFKGGCSIGFAPPFLCEDRAKRIIFPRTTRPYSANIRECFISFWKKCHRLACILGFIFKIDKNIPF